MDSNLLKTKSIEQLVGDVGTRRQGAQAHADRDRPDAARHRRHHRHRHLRADRDRGRQPGRPGHRALLRRRRTRLRLRGAVLRRVRVDDSDRRQRLHLRLRHARRDLRLDDRLGPDPRVRRRVDDGRGRVERLLPADSRRLWASTCRSGWRGAGGRRRGRVINLPAVLIVLVDHRAARHRRARERPRQRRRWSRSSSPRSSSSSSSASSYVEPANWSPFMPYGFAGRHGRRGRRLLRLHRLRRRLDDRRRSQEPAARSADRHHRVARRLHGCSICRRRHPHRHPAGRRSSRTTRSSSTRRSATRWR